jgi:hypothetical protein
VKLASRKSLGAGPSQLALAAWVICRRDHAGGLWKRRLVVGQFERTFPSRAKQAAKEFEAWGVRPQVRTGRTGFLNGSVRCQLCGWPTLVTATPQPRR